MYMPDDIMRSYMTRIMKQQISKCERGDDEINKGWWWWWWYRMIKGVKGKANDD